MHPLRLALRIALASAALSLAACAAHDTRTSYHGHGHQVRPGQIDYEKMARVNHAARSKGVEVVWVNPPYRSGGG